MRLTAGQLQYLLLHLPPANDERVGDTCRVAIPEREHVVDLNKRVRRQDAELSTVIFRRVRLVVDKESWYEWSLEVVQ